MLDKIAAALQKRACELFLLEHYEKKIETDRQTQILIDLEGFISNRIIKLKKIKA